MQHLLIRTARGLETILWELNWIFNICIVILYVACISTYLYYTTAYRQEWFMFMGVFFRFIILFAVLIMIENVLISRVKDGNRIAILSCADAERRGKSLGKQSDIFGIAWLISSFIGQFFIVGKMTDNSWARSVNSNSFLIGASFNFCKFLYATHVYARLAGKED